MKIKEYDASSSGSCVYREYNVTDGAIKVTRHTSYKKNKSTSDEDDGTSTKTQHSSGLVIRHRVKRVLSDLFLPVGYPDSVNGGYIQYQTYDSIQGLCSYLRGVVCTSAVLTAAGVGDAEATATSAAVQWATKDGCGMIGGLLFSYYSSVYFDSHVKEFRLFADVMNDIGLLLDMITPIICRRKKHVLYVSIGATLCRTMCGMAAGATKNSITIHFAKNNVADLSAKEGTQETLVSLVGMVLGISLARFLQDLEKACKEEGLHHSADDEVEDAMAIMLSWFYRNSATTATWFVFLLLTWIHVWANYVGVKTLRLRTLNYERCRMALVPVVDQAINIMERKQKTCLGFDEGTEKYLDFDADANDGVIQVNTVHNLIDMTVSDDEPHNPAAMVEAPLTPNNTLISEDAGNDNQEDEIDDSTISAKECSAGDKKAEILPGKIAKSINVEDLPEPNHWCCESLFDQSTRISDKAPECEKKVKDASAPIKETSIRDENTDCENKVKDTRSPLIDTSIRDEKTVIPANIEKPSTDEDLLKINQCYEALFDQGAKSLEQAPNCDDNKPKDSIFNIAQDATDNLCRPGIDQEPSSDTVKVSHAHSMMKGEVLPTEDSSDDVIIMDLKTQSITDTLTDENDDEDIQNASIVVTKAKDSSVIPEIEEALIQVDSIQELRESPTAETAEDMLLPKACCENIVDQAAKIFDIIPKSIALNIVQDKDGENLAKETAGVAEVDDEDSDDANEATDTHGEFQVNEEANATKAPKAHSMMKGEMLSGGNSCEEATNQTITITDNSEHDVAREDVVDSELDTRDDTKFSSPTPEKVQSIDKDTTDLEENILDLMKEEMLSEGNSCEEANNQTITIAGNNKHDDAREAIVDGELDARYDVKDSSTTPEKVQSVDKDTTDLEKNILDLDKCCGNIIQETSNTILDMIPKNEFTKVKEDERDDCNDVKVPIGSARNSASEEDEETLQESAEKGIDESSDAGAKGEVEKDKNQRSTISSAENIKAETATPTTACGLDTSAFCESLNNRTVNLLDKIPDCDSDGANYGTSVTNLCHTTQSGDDNDKQVGRHGRACTNFPMKMNDILQPSECNESLFKSFMGIIFRGNLVLGASLSETLKGMNNDDINATLKIFDDDHYILNILPSIGTSYVVYVSLRLGASENDILQSFLHALILQRYLELNALSTTPMDLISSSKQCVDALCSVQEDTLLDIMVERGWNRSLHFGSGRFRFQV